MLHALRARGLAFGYEGAAPLFSFVDFHLAPGWHGLVGANGAGKSTLLRLLAGELEPERGIVALEPRGARVVLCAQEPPPAAASPGERKRRQIEAAIAEAPDVLLLDEPTNHLDEAAREAIARALARFRGVGVVVSHDRALLDAVTVSTLRLRDGTVDHVPAPYAEARAAWELEERAALGERAQLRRAETAARRRLQDARSAHAGADAARSTRSRMKGPRDHDGRGMLAKIKVEGAEKRLGRLVAVRRAEAERAAERAESVRVVKEKGRSVLVAWTPCPRPRVLALDAPEVRVVEKGPVVLRDVHLVLGRADRVRVSGANGAGKTTLLRAMVARSTLEPDRLLYLPQELDEREARAHLDAVRAMPPDARGRVLSMVAALGVDPAQLLASASPSPGEARKLALARGLGGHVWALALDEPTNHLDLPSIERLERALAEYPGALLLVTHDEALARATTDKAWHVEAGRVEPR